MARDSTCCNSAWLLAYLLLASSSICSAVRDRTGAFIGYSEKAISGYGRCINKMVNCEQEAAMNRCLTDPYRMRRLCPVSCLVEPCVSRGTVLVSCGDLLLAEAIVALHQFQWVVARGMHQSVLASTDAAGRMHHHMHHHWR
jgi:hypothetical protein